MSDLAELRRRAESAARAWNCAIADYQAELRALEEYERRTFEWLRTGMANGVTWRPSTDTRERWAEGRRAA